MADGAYQEGKLSGYCIHRVVALLGIWLCISVLAVMFRTSSLSMGSVPIDLTHHRFRLQAYGCRTQREPTGCNQRSCLGGCVWHSHNSECFSEPSNRHVPFLQRLQHAFWDERRSCAISKLLIKRLDCEFHYSEFLAICGCSGNRTSAVAEDERLCHFFMFSIVTSFHMQWKGKYQILLIDTLMVRIGFFLELLNHSDSLILCMLIGKKECRGLQCKCGEKSHLVIPHNQHTGLYLAFQLAYI